MASYFDDVGVLQERLLRAAEDLAGTAGHQPTTAPQQQGEPAYEQQHATGASRAQNLELTFQA